jgi:hypothetical protein
MRKQHVTLDTTTGETKIEDIPPHLAHLEGQALMEALMHDCPECRVARERGETPTFGTGEDLARMARDIIRGRRPRWRNLKRRAGR